MEESKLEYWLKRGAAAAAIGLLVALFIGAFQGSSVIANDWLTPEASEPGESHEIALVGAGRIVLPRNETTEREGVWGVSNDTGAYGQITAVIEKDAETIERSFRTLTGRFIAGEMVILDEYAMGADPLEAFSIDFSEVRIPGDLGVNPAWLVRGDLDTWVILIHGEGLDERAQALRVLPLFEERGYPVLVVSYRNDSVAPDDGGFYKWGLTEWRDVEAAVNYAIGQGAEDFVTYGFGMGGTVAMMHLHESDHTADIRGLIVDSPVFDLGAVVDATANERGIPGLVGGAAKAVARIRFGLEWSQLNQLDRIPEFDVPMLLFHGTQDVVAPVEAADTFAAALPDLVTYERFDGGVRTELWNVDVERYNTAVTDFLLSVSDDPQNSR